MVVRGCCRCRESSTSRWRPPYWDGWRGRALQKSMSTMLRSSDVTLSISKMERRHHGTHRAAGYCTRYGCGPPGSGRSIYYCGSGTGVTMPGVDDDPKGMPNGLPGVGAMPAGTASSWIIPAPVGSFGSSRLSGFWPTNGCGIRFGLPSCCGSGEPAPCPPNGSNGLTPAAAPPPRRPLGSAGGCRTITGGRRRVGRGAPAATGAGGGLLGAALVARMTTRSNTDMALAPARREQIARRASQDDVQGLSFGHVDQLECHRRADHVIGVDDRRAAKPRPFRENHASRRVFRIERDPTGVEL